MRKIEPSDTRPRYRGPFYRSPATKEKKIGKCTPCISHGTISRSSLESRIRFLPSSMLAILALCSPPGIAVAGTPDIPPANAPIPATFVGIVAVCIFFRIFLFFTHVRSIFSDSTFFFSVTHFYAYRYRFCFLQSYIEFFRASPCIDHIRFRFRPFPRRPQSRHFHFHFFSVRVLAHLYIFCCIVAVW